jgi:hypothetical protein
VADICTVTCPSTSLRAVLHYVEEGWLGRSQNLVIGCVYATTPSTPVYSKPKEVPSSLIIAHISGCWQDKLYYTLTQSSNPTEKHLLIDLNPLQPAAKIVPPEEQQLPNESRRFWHDVTDAILRRDFERATQVKTELEERQREKARKREEGGETWKPRFFTGVFTPVGRPELTRDGEEALDGLQRGEYTLKESEVTGA